MMKHYTSPFPHFADGGTSASVDLDRSGTPPWVSKTVSNYSRREHHYVGTELIVRIHAICGSILEEDFQEPLTNPLPPNECAELVRRIAGHALGTNG